MHRARPPPPTIQHPSTARSPRGAHKEGGAGGDVTQAPGVRKRVCGCASAPRRPRAPNSGGVAGPGSGGRLALRRQLCAAAGVCRAAGGPCAARWFTRGGGGGARKFSCERQAAAGRGRRCSARGRRHHVEWPQLLHQPGGGRVRGVCGAHLLGHVWHRLHPPVRGWLQLHPALPGTATQAAGECRGPWRGHLPV